MSKLQQIVTYLESEKLDVAVVSDPVTINYLTGFLQWSPWTPNVPLCSLAAQETSPLCPSSKWSVQPILFPSQLWAMWILKIHGIKSKRFAAAWFQTCRCWVWQSHLDKVSWFENSLWNCWVWKPLLASNACASSNQLMKSKNDGCRYLRW